MKLDKLTYKPEIFYITFISILTLWTVYYIDWYYFMEWKSLGIIPRKAIGLKGIILSPFLHGSIKHLWSNSLALIILLPLNIYYYNKHWKKILIYGSIFSGIGTWVIASKGTHIGASGLIYALISYMLLSGILSKYYRLSAISFLIIIIYGSGFWYMFPNIKEGISWEGHLAGFITGTILAFKLDPPKYEPTYKYEWQNPKFNEDKDEFISQFDKNGNFKPKQLIETTEDGYTHNRTFESYSIEKIIRTIKK